MKNTATLLLSFLFFVNMSTAQESAREQIGDAIADYFELDRETLYAHFDKSIFFTNEDIWFKGYCFNKKQGTPFFETTNVFAVLLDDQGNQVAEQLVFSYIGSFQGNFKLGPQLKSGRYYVRFYTNWMNNFAEDESVVYPLQIVNENDRTITIYDKPDYSKINVTINPEGGHFVAGVANNIGVRVTDCAGNPVEARDAKIVNPKGEVLTTFAIGKNGCGKAFLTPDSSPLKVIIPVNGKTIDAPLPAAGDGIAVEVNNYALADKTIIKLRVNEQKLSQYSRPIFVVAQQNNKSTIFETTLKSTENELVIANTNLYSGVNVIRIIDQQLNELAQRIIFEMPLSVQDMSFSANKNNDKITIVGHSNFPNSDISISVLPDHTEAIPSACILGAFLIDPYLNEKVDNPEYYFQSPSKAKRYELDMLLLNQQSGKYDWRNIKQAPPKPAYSFDIGLAIKGSVNKKLPDPKKFRMLISSPLSMIKDYSAIDEKGEFSFPNLVFGNLSKFDFTLLKIPSEPVEATFFHQIQNRKRPFNKPFKVSPPCSPGKVVPIDAPQFAGNVIALDNVEIEGKSKSALKYRVRFGNANLRGYKIDDSYQGEALLSFIRANGFDVSNDLGEVSITGRLRTSINGQPNTPEVYINSKKLMTFDELQYIKMEEVDEIYLNPHAIVASVNNNMGVIKIYLKKLDYGNEKTATKSVEIKEGFAPVQTFESPLYISTSDKGFEKFGIIQWVPTTLTDSNGDFKFEIPATQAKSILLSIRGLSPEGKMISTEKTISLN